jgi:hypothetical protein
MRTRLPSALAALALAAVLPTPSAAAEATTTIDLKVVGCDGCKIQAVQNVDGSLPYTSPIKRVRQRHVEFVVPTERTAQMAFIVYAPFDEVAQAGFPMVVIVGFRGKEPGDRVSNSFANGVHQGSGCWSGTTGSVVTDKLIVTRQQVREPALGPGTFTAAAGHLKVTLAAQPYYGTRKASEMHVEDPSICR